MSDQDNTVGALQRLLDKLQLGDAPAGGALVVYQDGEWSEASTGLARADEPWTPDTLSLNYSTGKGVLATLVHVLVSAGVLAYDTPISHYWPDFGANGKQDITLRAVMSHQAGLYNSKSLAAEGLSMLDWDAMLAQVAAMPIAPPVPLSSAAKRQYAKAHSEIQSSHDNKRSQEQDNSQNSAQNSYQSVYSALVYGWVVGGVIEFATKQPLADALRRYLTKPLGIEEACYFGVPEAQLYRVARLAKDFAPDNIETLPDQEILSVYQQLKHYECWLKRAEDLGIKYQGGLNNEQINRLYFDPRLMDLSAYKAALSPPSKTMVDYQSAAVLQACIPAANGVASAKALANIYAMLANGGSWQGKTLIDEATFAELSRVHVTGMDGVMPAVAALDSKVKASMNWRLGYHRLPSACHDASGAFGHMGYNGSIAWCDPSRNQAAAYVHNYDVTMFTDIRHLVVSESVLAL